MAGDYPFDFIAEEMRKEIEKTLGKDAYEAFKKRLVVTLTASVRNAAESVNVLVESPASSMILQAKGEAEYIAVLIGAVEYICNEA